MASPIRPFLALSLALMPTGCCWLGESLVALSCGKRSQPFVTKSFRIPKDALDTFLGAVARDDADTVYESLSPELVRRWGVGKGEWPTLWKMIKENITAIHALDRARVVAKGRQTRDTAWFRLEYAGYQLRVELRRYAFVTCEYEEAGEDGDWVLLREGAYIRQDYGGLVQVQPHAEGTRATVQHPGVEFLELAGADIQLLAVGREWKILDLRMVDPDAPGQTP